MVELMIDGSILILYYNKRKSLRFPKSSREVFSLILSKRYIATRSDKNKWKCVTSKPNETIIKESCESLEFILLH
jgi:hypothetical protein